MVLLRLVTLCLGVTLEVSLTVPLKKNSKNNATFFFVEKDIRNTLIHDSQMLLLRSVASINANWCKVGVLADVRFLQVPRKRRWALRFTLSGASLAFFRRCDGRTEDCCFSFFYGTLWSAIGDHLRVPDCASMPYCLLGDAARV